MSNIKLYTQEKAIDIRREIAKSPAIDKLTKIERYIFQAGTNTQIQEMDDELLIIKTNQLFKYIAIDVGYNIPADQNMWSYTQTRLLDLLKKYYGNMSLSDVKLAFELAATGELDRYLPADSLGNPDRRHYQNFNVEYFSKILNAYRKKQNDVSSKVFEALPSRAPGISEEQREFLKKEREKRFREVFLHYKNNGELQMSEIEEMLLYNHLFEIGYAQDVQGSELDRQRALAAYMDKAAKGLVNSYTANQVKKQGISSTEIDCAANEIARRKEIKRAFDYMIEKGVAL